MKTTLLACVVPPWVQVAEHHGPFPDIAGLPGEQHLAGRGQAPQRLQSLVARDQARRALAHWGAKGSAIGRGAGGVPLFPVGYQGSLTHTRDYAGAAVARANAISFGIDVEKARHLGGEHRPFLTSREQKQLQRLQRREPDIPWAVILFCVKEAAYKASYPINRQWLSMTDAEAHLVRDGRFSVWLPGRNSGARLFLGKWVVGRGLVAAFAANVPLNDRPTSSLSFKPEGPNP